jgi:hypothetical protein
MNEYVGMEGRVLEWRVGMEDVSKEVIDLFDALRRRKSCDV